jgi:hypothetical protein
MLSTAESAAIHCALVLGLPEPQAAKSAGVDSAAASRAISLVEEVIPGRRVDFNRWFATEDPLRGDRRLLRYEIQLGRLEYQHDECIQSWRRTKEHADALQEQAPNVIDDNEKPRKVYVGDIRFLQLARNIRREMEKIEKLIDDRIEYLSKLAIPLFTPPKLPEIKPIGLTTCLPTPPPAVAAATPSAASPPVSAPKPIDPRLAKLLKAAAPAGEQTTSPARKPIPVIEPPPRKRDKYAGVHR